MMIVGCDFHPAWQQVAWVDTETGETTKHRLEHGSGEARAFYAALSAPALIGVEATGNCQWFLDLMMELRPKGDGLRACRRERFPNQESITCREGAVCKLLILRSRKSISDRLQICPVFPVVNRRVPRNHAELGTHSDALHPRTKTITPKKGAAPVVRLSRVPAANRETRT